MNKEVNEPKTPQSGESAEELLVPIENSPPASSEATESSPFGIAGKLFKAVGDTTATVGSFAGSSLTNLANGAERFARLTFASTSGKDNSELDFSPFQAAQAFEEWLRSKRKSDRIDTTIIPLADNNENQLYTILLEEAGLFGSRYLFAFTSEASISATASMSFKDSKFNGKALFVGQWPKLRFNFIEAEELSVFIWSDQIKLGKNNTAADYMTNWLVEEVTGSKFEEKALIENHPSQKPKAVEMSTLFTGHSHNQVLASLEPSILAPAGKAKEHTWLFSIYGQGGVGKSYLLQRIQELYGPRIIYIQVDHQQPEENQGKSLANLMDQFATRLRQSGCTTKRFEKVFHDLITYEASKAEIDLGEELKSVGKDSASAAQHFGKTFKTKSRSGKVAGAMQLAGLSAGIAGDLYNIFTHFSQKKGVVLENRAIQSLTYALVQDLAEFSTSQEKYYLRRRAVLVFDSYEQLSGLCDQWLRTVFFPELGVTSIDPVILLVGRHDPLRRDTRWSEYQQHMQVLKLEGFGRDETYEYLGKLGVDAGRSQEIYELTEGWPLLTALAARLGTEEEAIQAMSKRILEEIDEEWRQIFLDMVVPDGFNLDIVQKVLELDKTRNQLEIADRTFDYLSQATFIESREGRWHYLPPIRRVLLRYGELKSPVRIATIRERLAN